MSFDLGIWYADLAMDLASARAFYGHINQDWVSVRQSADFDAFWIALIDRFGAGGMLTATSENGIPGAFIMTTGELRRLAAKPPPTTEQAYETSDDRSPWAGSAHPTGALVALSIRYSQVKEVGPIVQGLALAHGLTFYNPQAAKVYQPASLRGAPAADLTTRLVLKLTGETPDVAAEITCDGKLVSKGAFRSRVEAHAAAAKIAALKGVAHYAFDDPACLAQAISFQSVDPNDPRFPPLPPDLSENISVRMMTLRE